MTSTFSTVVLAGDRAPGDPVAQAAGVSAKALSPIAGRPMVLRVLDVLNSIDAIRATILCGPAWDAVAALPELSHAITSGRIQWVAPQASPSASATYAMRIIPRDAPVLLTTADHAFLTPRVVTYFCSEALATGDDVAVGVAVYEHVLATYPSTRRTAIRLRDGAYCGCNLFAFLTPEGRDAAHFWTRVEQERKKSLRLIRTLGWTSVFNYLVGRLSLTQALSRLSRHMNLTISPVLLPFAEAAIDVDTLSDLALAQAIAQDSRRNPGLSHNQPQPIADR